MPAWDTRDTVGSKADRQEGREGKEGGKEEMRKNLPKNFLVFNNLSSRHTTWAGTLGF